MVLGGPVSQAPRNIRHNIELLVSIDATKSCGTMPRPEESRKEETLENPEQYAGERTPNKQRTHLSSKECGLPGFVNRKPAKAASALNLP